MRVWRRETEPGHIPRVWSIGTSFLVNSPVASPKSLTRWRCRSAGFSIQALFLLCRLLEISQIRRRLALLGGHEETVPTQEVDFIADGDMYIVFAAHGLFPPDWSIGSCAA